MEAAVNTSRHASSLVDESLSSRHARSQTLYRIACLTLFALVLRGLDIAGHSFGAASVVNVPVIWLLISVSVAGIAVFIKNKLSMRMQDSTGEFVLKYDVNVRVNVGVLKQWLRRQQPVQVRHVLLSLSNFVRCSMHNNTGIIHLQESRRGTRVVEQVLVTQASALKDNACSLRCVYETSSHRMVQIEIRGKRNAKAVATTTDYDKVLMTNVMDLLQSAGDFRTICTGCRADADLMFPLCGAATVSHFSVSGALIDVEKGDSQPAEEISTVKPENDAEGHEGTKDAGRDDDDAESLDDAPSAKAKDTV